VIIFGVSLSERKRGPSITRQCGRLQGIPSLKKKVLQSQEIILVERSARLMGVQIPRTPVYLFRQFFCPILFKEDKLNKVKRKYNENKNNM